MRLTLKRSGGFAGIEPPPQTLDTASLSPAAAQRVSALVKEADFFNLPASLIAPAPQPDRFQYTLAVTREDGKRHQVVCSEQAASEAFRRLLRAVQTGGEQQPG